MNDQSSNPKFPSDQKKEVGPFPFDQKCGNEHQKKEVGPFPFDQKCENEHMGFIAELERKGAKIHPKITQTQHPEAGEAQGEEFKGDERPQAQMFQPTVPFVHNIQEYERYLQLGREQKEWEMEKEEKEQKKRELSAAESQLFKLRFDLVGAQEEQSLQIKEKIRILEERKKELKDQIANIESEREQKKVNLLGLYFFSF